MMFMWVNSGRVPGGGFSSAFAWDAQAIIVSFIR